MEADILGGETYTVIVLAAETRVVGESLYLSWELQDLFTHHCKYILSLSFPQCPVEVETTVPSGSANAEPVFEEPFLEDLKFLFLGRNSHGGVVGYRFYYSWLTY